MFAFFRKLILQSYASFKFFRVCIMTLMSEKEELLIKITRLIQQIEWAGVILVPRASCTENFAHLRQHFLEHFKWSTGIEHYSSIQVVSFLENKFPPRKKHKYVNKIKKLKLDKHDF